MTTRPRRARAIDWGGRPSGNCAQCGKHVPHLEFDHIVPYFENGIHDLSNIQWLCHACHQAKTREEMRRWRETIGALQPRRTMSEERKRAVGDFFRGKPKSPEHVAKATEGMKRAWARKSPEERAAIAAKGADKNRGSKRGPMTEEHRRKIGEAQLRKWASGTRKPNPPEAVQAMREGAQRWIDTATPEQRAARGSAISKGRRHRKSQPSLPDFG